jgi:hypothetical protein
MLLGYLNFKRTKMLFSRSLVNGNNFADQGVQVNKVLLWSQNVDNFATLKVWK